MWLGCTRPGAGGCLQVRQGTSKPPTHEELAQWWADTGNTSTRSLSYELSTGKTEDNCGLVRRCLRFPLIPRSPEPPPEAPVCPSPTRCPYEGAQALSRVACPQATSGAERSELALDKAEHRSTLVLVMG